MKLDYRTIVWTAGGYLLFLMLSITVKFTDNMWVGIIPAFIGAIVGFVLDQYYKGRDAFEVKGESK